MVGASPFEHRVNLARGYCTLAITLWSVAIVLADPYCLIFWQQDAYHRNTSETGWFGLGCSVAFLVYLISDMAVGLACRKHFRRGMGAVFLHHVLVAVAVTAFLVPSPPRGFFLYVWGEALTAVRLLPPAPRWHARSAVFGFRRMLWFYVLIRDIWFFEWTSQRYGLFNAVVPPTIAVLLLGLDFMWWREHAESGKRRHAPRSRDEEEGFALCVQTTPSVVEATAPPCPTLANGSSSVCGSAGGSPLSSRGNIFIALDAQPDDPDGLDSP